jgi:hypothetical protein
MMIETEPQTDVASNPGMDLLVDAVVDGDETQAVAVANDLRNARNLL